MTKATDLVCIKKNCEGNKVIGGKRMEREEERGRERVSEHAEYSLAQQQQQQQQQQTNKQMHSRKKKQQ